MPNKKILMTFDCLKPNSNLKTAVLSAKTISKQFGWNPLAVSVISPKEVNWPTDFTADWKTEFEALGKSAITRFLKRNKIAVDFSTRILLQPYQTSKENARLVAQEAEKENASAIAVFTHVGKTMPHGSFVSSIIYESTRPILAINALAPKVKEKQKIERILLATDLSKEGERTFQSLLEFAKKIDAKIVLLHVLPTYFNDSLISSAGMAGGWGNVEAYLETEEKNARAKSDRWVREAKSHGVEVSVEILNSALSISKSVLKSAQRNRADLIAVTQKTGRWSSYILGSVTRDLLSQSRIPVFVVPTNAQRRNTRTK